MAEITFGDILRAVQKLTPQQKHVLAQSLATPDEERLPTREELLAETEALREAGAFNSVTSLRNRFASHSRDNLTNEQLTAEIHDFANEWEQELDEFFGNSD
jgi:hypothetical protein